jgi:AcrR family transcriptional regulator
VSAHIERVALALFAERGYTAVTLQEVAAAAGVSSRTLTRYFPLKEDLLLSQPRRSAEVSLAALREIPAGKHAVASLWDMWIELTRTNSEDLDELRLWYRAVATAPQAFARGGAEMSAVVSNSLMSVAAGTLGVSPEDVRAKVLAAALAAAQEAVLEHWLAQDGRGNLDDMFAAALDGLRIGFSQPAREAQPGDRPRPIS